MAGSWQGWEHFRIAILIYTIHILKHQYNVTEGPLLTHRCYCCGCHFCLSWRGIAPIWKNSVFGHSYFMKSLFLFYISRTLGHLNSLFLLKACTSLQMESVSHIFLEQHHIETDAWQWNSKWPRFQGIATFFCAPDW